jgi:hypothetical protein
MAKDRVICPFSNKLCIECALYRGRHVNLCYCSDYRGYLGVGKHRVEKKSINIPKNIAARPFDPYEVIRKEQMEANVNAD